MEEVNPDSITPLTDQQEVVLSVLSIISGVLSILGSSTIVYKVARNFQKSAPYDRLLLGLSSCDILSSLTFAISPFMLDSETSQRVWGLGNEATNNMLGFLTQFSFSAIFYNGMLSYYYLLTVRYGVKRKDFARKYEPYIHIGTIGFFLITATIGACMGFYGELDIGQGAWIVNWPEGCEATETCKSQYIGLAFGGVPTFFTFISLVVNNLRIYNHVRKQLGPENERDATNAGSAKQESDAVFDLTEMSSTSSRNSKSTQEPPKPSSSLSLGSIALSTTTNRRSAKHSAHIREVAMQGFLYVASFALAYTAGGTLRVLEGMDYQAKDEGGIYWLLVLDAFLKPLQGFMNIFVYCRPNYVRFRANYPELGRLWAIRKACLDPKIPRLPKGASVVDGRNTTLASRVAGGNQNLMEGVGVPISKSKSRSMKVGNFSSDLGVLKEESCEEDPSSRHSDREEEPEYEESVYEDYSDAEEDENIEVLETNIRRQSADLVEDPMTTNVVESKDAEPSVTNSTASEAKVAGVSPGRINWGGLKLDEASILDDMRKLYGPNGGTPEVSSRKEKQKHSEPFRTKRLTMDGTVRLSPVPVRNTPAHRHGESESS
jgi:hypothetical protein